MVRGNAINRESGENPEQTRSCNSYKTSRHFIMARYELQHCGCGEEIWREFGYKRRKP